MWWRWRWNSISSGVRTTSSISQEKISRRAARMTSPKRPWMTLRLKSEVVCIMRLVSPSSTGSQSENQVL